MVVAKNLSSTEEISKVYAYRDLYKYYLSTVQVQDEDAKVEDIIKAVYK